MGGEGLRANIALATVLRVTNIVLLCLLTFLTGLWLVGRRQSQHTRSGSDRLAKQRLTTLSTESDGSESRFSQVGFRSTLAGRALFHGWLLVIAVWQVSIIACIIAYNLSEDPFMNGVFTSFYYPSAILCIALTLLPDVRPLFLWPCPLCDATHVLIEENDEEKAALDSRSSWSSYAAGGGKRQTLVEVVSENNEWEFIYMCVRYCWKEEHQRFRPTGITELYCDSIDQNGLYTNTIERYLAQGKNAIDVPVLSLGAAILQQFLSPIFVFQLYSAYLAYYWLTWNLASVIVVSVVASGIRQAMQVRGGQQKIKDMVALDEPVEVLRDGQWIQVSCTDLVIYDVVRPSPGTLPADCVIVKGGAVTNESMLTGEPMPVQKFPVDPSGVKLDSHRHKKNMLFAGTELLQSDGLLCVVTATGAITAKGQLVRMILFPAPVRFKFEFELPFAYLSMGCYGVGCMLTMAAGADLSYLSLFGGTYCMLQAINPMLPVCLASGQACGVRRIEELGMRCLSPPRTAIAGKIHIVVCDKTGTLTECGMSLVGLQPGTKECMGHPCNFAGLSKEVVPVRVEELGSLWGPALASCHSVAQFEQRLVGPEIEVRMLEASGWTFNENKMARSFVRYDKAGPCLEAEVLRILEFDHNRMNSGALIRLTESSNSTNSKVVLFLKGGCEKLEAMIEAPTDFDQVTTSASARNLYVVGIAYRIIAEAEVDSLLHCPRAELESGLSILGLMFFKNELKPDTPSAIAELTSGKIRTCICSGDNVFTAVAVARQCGMCSKKANSVLIGDVEQSGEVVWKQEDGRLVSPTAPGFDKMEMAVTGTAFGMLAKLGQLDDFFLRMRVFGRMLPGQKVMVVNQYQKLGLVVGMCGDGGNDCAALRAAHVGVALSEAETSIVAPFSSGKNKSMYSVVNVAKVGRAVITTNFASYKFFLLSGLSVTFWKVFGYTRMGEWPGEYHFLTVDVIFPMVFTWGITSCCHAATQLAPVRPPSSLFGAITILGIIVPYLVYVSTFFVIMKVIQNQSWFVAPSLAFRAYELEGNLLSVYKTPDQYFSASVYIFMSSYLACMALFFSFGNVFRCPVYKNPPIMIVVCALIVFSMVLLYTGPHALGCIFRINCTNDIARNNFVPVFSHFSAWGTNGCFYGPQAGVWFAPLEHISAFDAMAISKGTTAKELAAAAKPYNLTETSTPKCKPLEDNGLPDVNPNNVFDRSWCGVLTVIIAVVVLVTGVFELLLVGRISARLADLRGGSKDVLANWEEAQMNMVCESSTNVVELAEIQCESTGMHVPVQAE